MSSYSRDPREKKAGIPSYQDVPGSSKFSYNGTPDWAGKLIMGDVSSFSLLSSTFVASLCSVAGLEWYRIEN
jgi:hypothetical protein